MVVANRVRLMTAHNMNQYGLDFRYMLEVLGLERVVVVGWSLGGSIAWSYMQKFGDERLAGYVNVDQRPFRYSTEEQLQELLTERRDRRLFHHMETIRVFLGPEAGEEEDVVKWMAYECMKTPTSANLAIFAESYRTDYRHFLPPSADSHQNFLGKIWVHHGGDGSAHERGDA